MLNNKARICVFVSGGGTNLQALIDAQDSGIIKILWMTTPFYTRSGKPVWWVWAAQPFPAT